MKNNILSSVLPHLAALIVFVGISVFYFYPQLEGKSIPQGDILNYKGMVQEIQEHKDKTGQATLWTNGMFGGMPAYQIHTPQSQNIFKKIEKVLMLGFDRPIGYFIYGMISFYIMLLIFGVNPWLAMVGAIAFSLTTNNLVLFEAGHTSKLRAIMASPLIIGGVIAVFRKKYVLGGLVFMLGMGLNLMSNHYQMTYYLGLSLMIFVLLEVIRAFRSGDVKHVGLSFLILFGGLCIAIGASASKLLPTYEYSKDTMRGKPILVTEGQASSSSEVEGLEYGYAMTWSNGVLDLFSSFIPGVVGGSSGEKISNDATFNKELRKLGAGNMKKAPLYWGSLPSTSGPIYFGAVVFFLCMLSFFVIKGNLKWWILGSILLTFMLSLGKNGGVFNEIVYNYVPFYNKFRTPNSILSITAVLLPAFAFIGLSQIIRIKEKETILKPLYITTGLMAVTCLFFAFAGSSFFDFYSPGDERLLQQIGGKDIFSEDRIGMMRSDSLRTLFLCLIMASLIWAYIKGKITHWIVIGVLAVLTIFDFVGIGRRYVDSQDFVNQRNITSFFTPRPVDTQIMKDTDLHFRVLDQTVNVFNSSKPSYFHKSIGGNHAAKLQRYQDLIDRHISKGNQRVINMLNTKYFIMGDQNGQADYQLNPAAAGNAWFVSSITMVDSPNAEIDALASFDPKGEAIVHNEYQDYFDQTSFDKNGSIRLTSYSPDRLEYTVNASSDQMAVFSEIWYGPNKGWKAYIDDQPVEHIRVNYALRGLRIPSGQHNVVFEFDPPIYKAGSTISMISSGLFLLLFVVGLIFLFMQRGKLIMNEVSTDPNVNTQRASGTVSNDVQSNQTSQKITSASQKKKTTLRDKKGKKKKK